MRSLVTLTKLSTTGAASIYIVIDDIVVVGTEKPFGEMSDTHTVVYTSRHRFAVKESPEKVLELCDKTLRREPYFGNRPPL